MELKIKITESYLGKTIIINGSKLEIEEVDSLEHVLGDIDEQKILDKLINDAKKTGIPQSAPPIVELSKKKLGWPKGKPRGPRKKASKTQTLNLRKKPGPKPGFKKATADSHKSVIQENEIVATGVHVQ